MKPTVIEYAERELKEMESGRVHVPPEVAKQYTRDLKLLLNACYYFELTGDQLLADVCERYMQEREPLWREIEHWSRTKGGPYDMTSAGAFYLYSSAAKLQAAGEDAHHPFVIEGLTLCMFATSRLSAMGGPDLLRAAHMYGLDRRRNGRN